MIWLEIRVYTIKDIKKINDRVHGIIVISGIIIDCTTIIFW